MVYTKWTHEPTDIVDENGRPIVIPWAYNDDAPISFDFSDILATSEVITTVTVTLWRLQSTIEVADVDQTSVTTIPQAADIDGASVAIRVKALERGRVYRLFMQIGEAGNKRSRSTVIDVAKTGVA